MDITKIQYDVLKEEKFLDMESDKVCIPLVFSAKYTESEVRYVLTLFLWLL
jgi:hypothetical protein